MLSLIMRPSGTLVAHPIASRQSALNQAASSSFKVMTSKKKESEKESEGVFFKSLNDVHRCICVTQGSRSTLHSIDYIAQKVSAYAVCPLTDIRYKIETIL